MRLTLGSICERVTATTAVVTMNTPMNHQNVSKGKQEQNYTNSPPPPSPENSADLDVQSYMEAARSEVGLP